MLVELKEVEVFIEPTEILTQALVDGDITVNTIVKECIIEEDYESVLDAVDNSDIINYVKEYDLDIEINNYDFVLRSIKEFPQSHKAQLLWHLLKCEEN